MIKMLLLLFIVSCSGSDIKTSAKGPQIKTKNDPSTNSRQLILSHPLQTGTLRWSIRIRDNGADTESETSSNQDLCELKVLNVGSEEFVEFKDSLQTPFCSNFEIDPISTIDNITIIAPNDRLEVCLNETCSELP